VAHHPIQLTNGLAQSNALSCINSMPLILNLIRKLPRPSAAQVLVSSGLAPGVS